MKKLLSTILAITMMLSMSIVYAQEEGISSAKTAIERSVHNVISTKGIIKEINKDQYIFESWN